jgi:hypothetical protein
MGWRISCKALGEPGSALMVTVVCPDTGSSKYWRVEAAGRISTIAKTPEQLDVTIALLTRLNAVEILVEPVAIRDPYPAGTCPQPP